MTMDYTKVMKIAHAYSDIIESRVKNIGSPEKMGSSFTKLPSHQVPILTEYKNYLWLCVEVLRGEMPLNKAIMTVGWISNYIYQKGWMTADEIESLTNS